MTANRRTFVAATLALPVMAACGVSPHTEEQAMYGLIGKFNASPNQRDELIQILLEGVRDMPGCLSYIVAKDAQDENGIWITEVWDSKESHAASLSLPSVREAIRRGKPLIAGFGERFETAPVGGEGLEDS